jgi:hypothetical protein
MKQLFFALSCLFVVSFSGAQSGPIIANFPLKALDIVVFPYGMEYPIKIGTVSDKGNITFMLSADATPVPAEAKKTINSGIIDLLLSKCDNYQNLLEYKNKGMGAKADPIALWTHDNRYAGVLFPVTSEEMVPWREDPYYMEPVLGSYYELIYSETNFDIQTECTTTVNLSSGDVPLVVRFDLKIEPGFNFIEYKIESIYKTDPNETASLPNLVHVKSLKKEIPEVKWVAKYF